jgi:hypothetical protein
MQQRLCPMQQVFGFHSYGIRSHPVFNSRLLAYPTATRHQETSHYQGGVLLDPLEDDDDIEWKHNPFDVDHVTESGETPEELMVKITFEGSPQLQTKLKALVLEFKDVFATEVRKVPADVEPMKIVVDREKWMHS